MSTMLNAMALTLCEVCIRAEMGRLDDLPPQVANTIANVYYRFFLMTAATVQRQPLPLPIREGTDDPIHALIAAGRAVAERKAAMKAIPEMVACLRELDPAQQPNAYRAAVDYFLDVFKYRIPDAHRKTGLRRMIERRFRKVDEIPGLVAALDIRGMPASSVPAPQPSEGDAARRPCGELRAAGAGPESSPAPKQSSEPVQRLSVPCQRCGTRGPVDYHRNINASRHPDLKAQLLRAEVNRLQCPKCSTVGYLDDPLLYHDPARSLMVALGTNDARAEMGKGMAHMLGHAFLTCTRRGVESIPELREKVMLADDGLSDVAVEVLKTFFCNDPANEGLRLFYCGIGQQDGHEVLALEVVPSRPGRQFAAMPLAAYKRALAFSRPLSTTIDADPGFPRLTDDMIRTFILSHEP